MKKNGFTLIEIIVVVAIVAVVSSVIVVSYNKIINNANDKAYTKAVDAIQSAAEVFTTVAEYEEAGEVKSILNKVSRDCCSVDVPLNTLVSEGLLNEKLLSKVYKKDIKRL